MAYSHYTGLGQRQGPRNDGFLYYAMYCTHYIVHGTIVFYCALCSSHSLSLPQSRAVCLSHKTHSYHLQQSWGKVIFLEACVKNSVHSREGGGSSGPHPVGGWGVWLVGSPGPHPGGEVEGSGWGVSRPTPRGEVEWSGQKGLQAHTQGGGWGVWLGGSPGPHPGGVQAHAWGVYPRHALRQTYPQADGHCCGWYASYWNAFLWQLQLWLPVPWFERTVKQLWIATNLCRTGNHNKNVPRISSVNSFCCVKQWQLMRYFYLLKAVDSK